MTLQQLRYIIEIAQSGSISLAAQRLFITQPSLSKSVADLEKEMGITIFYRGSRGVMLSPDGVKFLAYARQVVEQADLLEQQYKFGTPVRRVFALSAQHYAVVASAFIDLVREYREDQYEFTLRESRTYDIIEDVRTQRSELGILFLSHFNREVLLRIIRDAELEFVPLFTARPHIFVSTDHPLARRSSVTLDELRSYPRLVYEQGLHNSFYFSEEPHSTAESPKNIVVTDRATLFNLLVGLGAYTISSGIIHQDASGSRITSVPLESDEIMQIGYLHPKDQPLSRLGQRYLEFLQPYLRQKSPSVSDAGTEPDPLCLEYRVPIVLGYGYQSLISIGI